MLAAPRAANAWRSKDLFRGGILSAMSLRLVQSADFERLLAVPSRLRSPHFAVHHLPQPPLPKPKPSAKVAEHADESAGKMLIPSFATELSTEATPKSEAIVDKPLADHWLGCVVPKRHAKRAVTRNLLKRQIRSVFDALSTDLPGGQWVVRLRSPFAPTQFVSARSLALKLAARTELVALLTRAGSIKF